MKTTEDLDTEADTLTSKLESTWAEIEALQDTRKKLSDDLERVRKRQFAIAREAGTFDIETMDNAAFTALNKFASSAGMDTWRWARERLGQFHKRISHSGSYRSDTYQEVFELSLTRGQDIDPALVEAVTRVSEFAQVDDGPVYWSLFDHRLSSDGIHELIVYPQDGTAQIGVTTHGRENTGDIVPIVEALREAARDHWYDDPNASDYDADDDY